MNSPNEQRQGVIEHRNGRYHGLLTFGVVKVVKNRIGVVLELKIDNTWHQVAELLLEATKIAPVPGCDNEGFRART